MLTREQKNEEIVLELVAPHHGPPQIMERVLALDTPHNPTAVVLSLLSWCALSATPSWGLILTLPSNGTRANERSFTLGEIRVSSPALGASCARLLLEIGIPISWWGWPVFLGGIMFSGIQFFKNLLLSFLFTPDETPFIVSDISGGVFAHCGHCAHLNKSIVVSP
jgi:hypothetical protein